MSNYNLEHLEESFGKTPPEERLQILRHEMLRPITALRAHAFLLSKIIENNEADLPEDIQEYVNKVTQAGDEILAILEALTSHSE